MDMENPEQRFSIVHNILQGLLPPDWRERTEQAQIPTIRRNINEQ
jgi:hypothetical protein